jgi:hypothetical protein
MATTTPTLTIASTDAFSDPLSFSTTINLTTASPSAGITRVSTAENPFGEGAGVIIPESTSQYFVYVKHLGVLASDGTTPTTTSDGNFVTLSDVDGTAGLTIKLQPSEFAFFPMKEGDGSAGSGGDGGLKVTAASAAVMIEYAYFAR